MMVTTRAVGALLMLAVPGAAATVSKPARADAPACIAASDAEIVLRQQQKLRAALDQLVLCSAPSCPPTSRPSVTDA